RVMSVLTLRDDLPNRHRLRHSLCRDRLCVAELEQLAGRPVGLLTDQDSVDWSSRFNPRGGVHYVTRCRPLALTRTGTDHHERLAGVDPDPEVEVKPLVLRVQLRERVSYGERGADGTLGIVLVSARRAEERENRVAAELL